MLNKCELQEKLRVAEVYSLEHVRTEQSAWLGYATVGGTDDYGCNWKERIAIVVHCDDVVFTPMDWQGRQPDMKDDLNIEAAHWMEMPSQKRALYLNKLPRLLI